MGTAAQRLTCNGGGEAGLGVQLCPCAPAQPVPRLCSTLWRLSSLWDSAPRSTELWTWDSFLRCRSCSVFEGRGLLPSLQAGLRCQKNVKPTRLGEKTWEKDLIHLIHLFIHTFIHSLNGVSFVRRVKRGSAGLSNPLRADKLFKSLRNV